MSKGIFTISLDFELHWGGFEKWPIRVAGCDGTHLAPYNKYFLNTRQVIPQMLDLFKLHEVHATWATVGMLFHQSKAELLRNAPLLKPTYTQSQLSAYGFIEAQGIGENEQEDPFHFAPSLIKQIQGTLNQELGTHTFAHYYCNEGGQTLDQFREDLKAAQRVAQMYNVVLKSLVFPRNQFNDSYLKVCHEEGITSVRSNPLDWFWRIDSTQRESKWKRLNRGLDAYVSIGKQNTFSLENLRPRKGYPLAIPASRLLRPYNPKELFLNRLKIDRIKSEMTRAAKHGEVYHLWWHPHNFGNYPNQSLLGLQQILTHYDYCRERYQMESKNMSELTTMVDIFKVCS